MRKVRSENTSPEMKVRRLVYSMGYRYRLHRKELPGKPDLTFFSRKKVIFIHGCFWHGHSCKRGARIPKTNTEYWIQKIEKNKVRDEKNIRSLHEKGFQVLILWECEIKEESQLKGKILAFLGE